MKKKRGKDGEREREGRRRKLIKIAFDMIFLLLPGHRFGVGKRKSRPLWGIP